VFENRVLRGIYGSERDEVTAECSNYYNEDDQIRSMRWAGYVVRMGR
jgi:hypothetical protein